MLKRSDRLFLATLCHTPFAKTHVRQPQSAPSSPERPTAPNPLSRLAGCPPCDRSPPDPGIRPENAEAQPVNARLFSPHPLASWDKETPNPPQSGRGKALWPRQAFAARQITALLPLEPVSASARLIQSCSCCHEINVS